MNEYDNIFQLAADRYGVDKDLLLRIAQAESNFDPNAVSPAGAQGIMQLMPGTALDMGVTDVFDPEQNIMGGSRYFSEMMGAFGGDPRLALAAYNMGPGALQQRGLDYSGVPETNAYVNKIMGGGGIPSTPNITAESEAPPITPTPTPNMPTTVDNNNAIPPGFMGVPEPRENLGFWETIRNAARNDPYTFYSVLGALARNDSAGISSAMAQRVEREYRRDVINARKDIAQYTTARRKGESNERYVERVRTKASSGPYLAEFEEQLGGVVDTVEEAQALERYISVRKGEEKMTTYKDNAMKMLVKNPGYRPPKEIAKVFNKNDSSYDPNYVQAWIDIKKGLLEVRQSNLYEKSRRRKLLDLQIERLNNIIRQPQVNKKVKEQLTTYRQRLNDIDGRRNDVFNRLQEYMVYEGVLGEGHMFSEQQSQLQEELNSLDTQYNQMISLIDQTTQAIYAGVEIPTTEDEGDDDKGGGKGDDKDNKEGKLSGNDNELLDEFDKVLDVKE